jgi:hypothetical protein
MGGEMQKMACSRKDRICYLVGDGADKVKKAILPKQCLQFHEPEAKLAEQSSFLL